MDVVIHSMLAATVIHVQVLIQDMVVVLDELTIGAAVVLEDIVVLIILVVTLQHVGSVLLHGIMKQLELQLLLLLMHHKKLQLEQHIVVL